MLKQSWIAFFAILLLCFAMPSPSYAATSSKSAKTAVKKAAKSVDKTEKHAKKSVSKKSAKAQKAVKAQASSDREVWMRRAKSSEALTGKASWYGKDFHNKSTASGLAYDMHTFTAAHRTLPIGTIVKVTEQHGGKSVMVCVTDRGPFVHGRIIDVSYAAAQKLGLAKRGVGKVELEVVSDENGQPIKKDQAYFVKFSGGDGKSKAGPFHAFADAAAMREALSKAHPEAEVVLEKNVKP